MIICRSKLPKKTHTHLNYSYIRQNVVWWAIVCNPFRTLNLFKPAEDWNPVMSQSCLKEENLIHIQNWTTLTAIMEFLSIYYYYFFFWKKCEYHKWRPLIANLDTLFISFKGSRFENTPCSRRSLPVKL